MSKSKTDRQQRLVRISEATGIPLANCPVLYNTVEQEIKNILEQEGSLFISGFFRLWVQTGKKTHFLNGTMSVLRITVSPTIYQLWQPELNRHKRVVPARWRERFEGSRLQARIEELRNENIRDSGATEGSGV